MLTNSLDQFSHPTFVVKVRAFEDIKEPIVAFKFKSMKNEEIMGSNTMYENVDLKMIKAGEIITVTFKFYLPLAAGEYLIDFGFTTYEKDNLVVINRNYEVTTVNVLSTRHNVGWVNPDTEVEIERE